MFLLPPVPLRSAGSSFLISRFHSGLPEPEPPSPVDEPFLEIKGKRLRDKDMVYLRIKIVDDVLKTGVELVLVSSDVHVSVQLVQCLHLDFLQ